MSACPSCAKTPVWPDYRRGRRGLCGECYARRDHPAGKTRIRDKREPAPSPLTLVPGGRDAVNAWLQHVPGCGCDRCGYVEAHLDAGDDKRGAMTR